VVRSTVPGARIDGDRHRVVAQARAARRFIGKLGGAANIVRSDD
jgi:hypothetical protein